MSLFPAVRHAGGPQAQAQPAPSPSRTSVMQAQQQQQQQQHAQTQQLQSNSSTSTLPRISPSSTRVRDQQPPAASTTAAAAAVAAAAVPVRRSGSKSRLEAALAAGGNSSSGGGVASFAQFVAPWCSGALPNSLRITDARMHHPSPDATLSQSALWSSLNIDALNSYLSDPELSPAERALNGEKLGREHAGIVSAVQRAHQALDVSKLTGVRHFAANFGCSEVGGRTRVLFLQIENTQAPEAGSAGGNGGSESGASATDTAAGGVLQSPPGSVSWRVRTPTELDVSVEHWAALGGSDGGLDGPTDERRFHQSLADRGVFSVRPRRGTLARGQSALLEIAYNPLFIGDHTLPLLFQCRGGKHFTIVVRASTVQHMPAIFSFHHLQESFEIEQSIPSDGGGGGSGGKNGVAEEEKAKETLFLTTSSTPLNPFLPSPTAPFHTHTLHDTPIGLGLGPSSSFSASSSGGEAAGGEEGTEGAQAPLQCFPLLNHSGVDLRYRVHLAPLRRLQERSHGVAVLSLLGDVVRVPRDETHGYEQGDDGDDGADDTEECIEGVVRAGSTGTLRFLFRPIETREIRVRLRIQLLDERSGRADPARVQWLCVRGRGVRPDRYALEPFPSVRSMPRAQTLLLPGQLAALSEDCVSFGDVPLFGQGSRVLSLRNLCAAETIQYAFVHSVRPPRSTWSRALLAERRVRALIQGDADSGAEGPAGGGEGHGHDHDHVAHPTDADEESEALAHGDLDAYESAHVAFYPPGGVLGPGQSVQILADLHGGPRALVLHRDVAVHVRVVAPGSSEGGGGDGGGAGGAAGVDGAGSSRAQQGPVDHFGYNRTASVALGARTPITSSTPSALRLRTAPRTDVRDGRPVSSMLGVGSGLAGMDVRVDYPAKPAVPLNVTTLARRSAALQAGLSDPERLEAQAREGRATAHLAPTMAQLASVPSRATWFPDAAAPIAEMARSTYNKLSIQVQARVLPAAELERQDGFRRAAFAPARQIAAQRLPQQTLTEVLNQDSTVRQRFFVPQVGDEAEAQADASHSPYLQQQQHQQQQQAHSLHDDGTGAAIIESSLLELLRTTLAQTSVTESFGHLRPDPIPFFADLLAAHTGQAPAPETVAAAAAAAEAAATGKPASSAVPALAHSSPSFENWSEAILNETLLKLTIEAQQAQRSGFILDATPKLFVAHAPR